jgi:hypothetical protein
MFNKGDIVKSKYTHAGLVEGRVYTVVHVGTEYLQVNGLTGGWLHYRFTLLSKAKPEAAPVRATDPDTSHTAAVKVEPKVAGIKQNIMLHLTLMGALGATGTEIAESDKLRLNSVTPRFAELRKAEKIKDSGQRRDGQIVWVLA